MNQSFQNFPGTIIWIAPFYNRSGYGVLARATVMALHRRGIPVKVIPVDQVEPGIDDSDMNLIRSLQLTPIIPPVTAIVSHVPNKSWADMSLPEPNIRILSTTFDSSAQGNVPPSDWLDVFHKMEQIWVQSHKEQEVFVSAGVPPEKVHIVHFPNPWKDNPVLPPVSPEYTGADKPFRFLSIAMFQPRRRWDVLIESYLEEFKNGEHVELYLKVNYPPWHPVPGKPKQDLYDLISSLRSKTGSNAPIIIDEELGTRKGIVELIDSANTYVSTDTAPTAPVSEAIVRHRLVIASLALKMMPREYFVGINEDTNVKVPLTPDMLMYQPHHKDAYMPQLKVVQVKRALRRAYTLTVEGRALCCNGAQRSIPGADETIPMILGAIHAGWQYKDKLDREDKAQNTTKRVVWEGSQFVRHSLALINRELCLRLIDKGFEVSIIPYEKDDFSPEIDPRFEKIAERTNKPLTGRADIHIRHKWPPNFERPRDGYWVMIQPWEFGSLPKDWVGPMSTMLDEMWVPSSFVRECYVRSGIPAERVFVVPNGVDVNRFHPDATPIKLATKKRFKFLFVGGTIPRKGIDILLEVYSSTFTSDDDVCLIIKDMGAKTFYQGQTAQQMIKGYQSAPNAPEIEYIEEMLPDEELSGLYRACDCLVHPYRGEGFGLPIAEAMASGLPVIVTGYGAALDFCPDDVAYLIPATETRLSEKRIGDLETIDFPWLAEPDREGLATLMKHVADHREEAAARGKLAAAFIRDHFTWEHAADIAMERIRRLRDRPVFRHTPAADPLEQSLDIGELLRAGEECFGRGDVTRAVALFRRVLKLDLKNAQALNNLGVIQWQLGETLSALDTFQIALTFNPNDHDALENLLQAARETGRFDRIDQTLVETLNKAQPGSPEVMKLSEACRGEYEDAKELQLKELLEKGEECYSQGDMQTAIDIFQKILLLDGNNSQALNNIGVIQWQLGDPSLAMRTFQEALAINPRDPDALANLLHAAKETGRFDLVSQELLDTVKETQPGNPDVNLLAELMESPTEDTPGQVC